MASRVPPHPLDQVAVLDSQTRDQLEDHVETRQPVAVLDHAEERAIDPDPVRQLPLGETGWAAEPDHVGAEPFSQGPLSLDPLIFLAEAAHSAPSSGESSSQASPVSRAQGSTSTAPASFTIVSRRGTRL